MWQKLNEYYTKLEKSPLFTAAVILYPGRGIRWLEIIWNTRDQLIWLQEQKYLPMDPPLESEDVDRLSKADFLVKGIALIQVGWVLVQAIARTMEHLPMAELFPSIPVLVPAAC